MQTLLIIEDDPALARGLKDNFLQEGYDVIHSADGNEGLDIALDQTVDMILLDIMLPGINGYEICEAVRREKEEIPILMLSAKGQEQDIIRGLEMGADDYITKPFSINELKVRVKNFLRRYSGQKQELYKFGDCELDLSSHTFLKEGKEVDLTSKEFRLLAFFLGREGRALTREQILAGVWGNSILVTRRSVDRCVTTLRAKIEPNSKVPSFIRTIRDVGYRFEIDR